MRTDEPPAFWLCPDCGYRNALAVKVYAHMSASHAVDHGGEQLGHDPETFAPRWETPSS